MPNDLSAASRNRAQGMSSYRDGPPGGNKQIPSLQDAVLHGSGGGAIVTLMPTGRCKGPPGINLSSKAEGELPSPAPPVPHSAVLAGEAPDAPAPGCRGECFANRLRPAAAAASPELRVAESCSMSSSARRSISSLHQAMAWWSADAHTPAAEKLTAAQIPLSHPPSLRPMSWHFSPGMEGSEAQTPCGHSVSSEGTRKSRGPPAIDTTGTCTFLGGHKRGGGHEYSPSPSPGNRGSRIVHNRERVSTRDRKQRRGRSACPHPLCCKTPIEPREGQGEGQRRFQVGACEGDDRQHTAGSSPAP